jgi:hypothetical protein
MVSGHQPWVLHSTGAEERKEVWRTKTQRNEGTRRGELTLLF